MPREYIPDRYEFSTIHSSRHDGIWAKLQRIGKVAMDYINHSVGVIGKSSMFVTRYYI